MSPTLTNVFNSVRTVFAAVSLGLAVYNFAHMPPTTLPQRTTRRFDIASAQQRATEANLSRLANNTIIQKPPKKTFPFKGAESVFPFPA